MSTITQMAEAHLQTVQKAISDLNNQKSAIDQEINKLTDYLHKGIEELNKSKAQNDSLINESSKQYLGE